MLSTADRKRRSHEGNHVVSKLKCPVFVAHDMSGSWSMDRRRGCGKVGIPRLLRDFQAQWKTCFLFSTQRLFHNLFPAIQFALAQPRPSLRGVATDDVWPVPDTPGFIQMLAHRDRTNPLAFPANASARSEKLFLPPRPYYPGSPRAAVAPRTPRPGPFSGRAKTLCPAATPRPETAD